MTDYKTHSKLSNPGKYSHLYDALPSDMDGLHHVVNNIFIHIWKMAKLDVPDERKSDFVIRTVEAILACVVAYDDAPLTKQRPRSKQFIGDCRHAALLLCSMLRHQGIPARVRSGFCQYISSNTENYTHHVITEYWDGSRWVLEDPDIIRHDIPASEFLFGWQVWQMFRAGNIDTEKFYLTADLQGDWIYPLPFLRDLASLAKHEVQSSDMWGIIKPYYAMTDAEKIILDDAAKMLAETSDLDSEAQRIYQKYPMLKVSQPLYSWDWVTDDMIEFDISESESL